MESLTTAEETLIAMLSLLTAGRVGALARANGYPPPTDEEALEAGRLQVGAFTEFVAGLRRSERAPTADELEEYVQGVAEGALLRTMGAPPHTRQNQN